MAKKTSTPAKPPPTRPRPRWNAMTSATASARRPLMSLRKASRPGAGGATSARRTAAVVAMRLGLEVLRQDRHLEEVVAVFVVVLVDHGDELAIQLHLGGVLLAGTGDDLDRRAAEELLQVG